MQAISGIKKSDKLPNIGNNKPPRSYVFPILFNEKV